jgi:predicted alpha/beta superfamily hydrolase
MKTMSDTLRSAFDRVTRRENRRASVRRGRIERIDAFASKILGNQRSITVYLPPGYDDRNDRRYPVLYMQDGQNLFDPALAFGGVPWRIADAAENAIGKFAAQPMIIVGVDNMGEQRIAEYTPTRVEEKGGGGRADDYGRMLVEELKPVIDAGFRTLPDRDNTAIGGSSLGGLVSMYLALKRSDVFGRAAVMSPSTWWDKRMILREVDAFGGPDRPRVWLDIGGREGREALADARMLDQRLRAKGWSDANYEYYEDRKGDHSERAWSHRAPMMLEFLFGTE